MRLPKAERTARLVTRRRNALLAVVERWVRGEERDPLVLSRAMDAYVDALPSSRRRRPPGSVQREWWDIVGSDEGVAREDLDLLVRIEVPT